MIIPLNDIVLFQRNENYGNSSSAFGLWDFSKTFLIPILVGAISYILTSKLNEWKNRRMQSKLGVAIIDSLIEEVNNGVNIYEASKLNEGVMGMPPFSNMPCASWKGMQTIPDEILLRLLILSENLEVNRTASFSINEIRSHLKNYFEHMCLNWNKWNMNKERSKVELIQEFIAIGQYDIAAKKVLQMLIEARVLLIENSKKKFPK